MYWLSFHAIIYYMMVPPPHIIITHLSRVTIAYPSHIIPCYHMWSYHHHTLLLVLISLVYPSYRWYLIYITSSYSPNHQVELDTNYTQSFYFVTLPSVTHAEQGGIAVSDPPSGKMTWSPTRKWKKTRGKNVTASGMHTRVNTAETSTEGVWLIEWLSDYMIEWFYFHLSRIIIYTKYII